MKVDSPDGTLLNSNCDLCNYVADRSKWTEPKYVVINKLCSVFLTLNPIVVLT